MNKDKAKQQETDKPEGEASNAALDALDALASDEQEAESQDESLALSVTSEADKAEQEKQAQASREQAAKMGAYMAVGFGEKMLQMRLPYVEVDQASREGLVESLAPVLEKHGGGMPPWLVPYAEELRFGMTLAGFGFGVWMQVQAHREELAAANDDKPEPVKDQGSQGAAPAARVPQVRAAVGDGLDPNAGE